MLSYNLQKGKLYCSEDTFNNFFLHLEFVYLIEKFVMIKQAN